RRPAASARGGGDELFGGGAEGGIDGHAVLDAGAGEDEDDLAHGEGGGARGGPRVGLRLRVVGGGARLHLGARDGIGLEVDDDEGPVLFEQEVDAPFGERAVAGGDGERHFAQAAGRGEGAGDGIRAHGARGNLSDLAFAAQQAVLTRDGRGEALRVVRARQVGALEERVDGDAEVCRAAAAQVALRVLELVRVLEVGGGEDAERFRRGGEQRLAGVDPRLAGGERLRDGIGRGSIGVDAEGGDLRA